MRRRLLAISALLAGLVLASPAGARADVGRFVAAVPVDTISIQRLGDLDVARDGTGAVVYVRSDGGVDHAFVSRLVGGVFQPPERLDATLPGAASQPVVAAGDGGSLAVAFISGGTLVTTVRPAADQPWTAPQSLAAPASDPSIDLSINGVSYVSFTSTAGPGGGDVAVARKERKATAFALVPTALDIDPADGAGLGTGRSRVAVAADGVATVVWGENGHVFARRVFEQRPSVAPQDATPAVVGGHGGGAADLPDVDVQDDSSFAWVVFRQQLDDGLTHAVGRRLLGSQFDPPALVDGQGIPGGDSVGPPRIAVDGRGDGYVASATTGTATGAVIKDRVLNAGVPLGGALAGQGFPAAAADESGDGLVAWVGADSAVHARAYTNVRASRTVQSPQADALLSGAGVDGTAGLEAAADRAGDVVVAFTAGPPGARALMVATFDRAPGSFAGTSSTGFRNIAATPLRWSPSFELWGPVTYTLQVDGQTVGTTAQTALAVPNLPDGLHTWRVIATDRGGQVTATPIRNLRQDATPPRATVTISGGRRRGRPIKVTVRPTDTNPAGRPASGVGRVIIAFGDGSQIAAQRATHRYGRGRFTVRVSVRDRAGNVVVVRRAITIR